MYLRSFANKQQLTPDRFVSWGLILLIFFGISIILYLLFPRHATQWRFSEENTHQLSIQYLETLVARYPEDVGLRVRLAQQQIVMGKLEQAQQVLAPLSSLKAKTPAWWQLQWLNYSILRIKTFALAPKTQARAALNRQLLASIKKLSEAPLTVTRLDQLSQDAASLGNPKLSFTILKRVASLSTTHSMVWYAHAGALALMLKHYQDSAHFYFAAQNQAEKVAEQRHYFIKALLSLQSGNFLAMIMPQAEQHIGNLMNDSETLMFLAKMALATNQPKLAEIYANKALTLG